MNVTERQARQNDFSFLWNLKVASMRAYIDQVYGWEEQGQRAYFEKDFRPDDLVIIQVDGIDAGMYELVLDETEYFLKRIEVHPQFQGQRVGSQVIQSILQRAESECKPVRLMVFKINPARFLYDRLGFKRVAETETHYEMMWQSKSMQKTPDINR